MTGQNYFAATLLTYSTPLGHARRQMLLVSSHIRKIWRWEMSKGGEIGSSFLLVMDALPSPAFLASCTRTRAAFMQVQAGLY
jgi:hypothetical protein